MKLFHVVAVAVALALNVSAGASEQPEYIGSWSNGKGQTLKITAASIQFNKDAPIKYRDVTEDDEGGGYELELIGAPAPNGFGGNFVVLEFEGDQMQMTVYPTRTDVDEEDKITAAVSWTRQE